MKNKALFILPLLWVSITCKSQEEPEDTVGILTEVIVKAFEQNRKLNQTSSIIKILESNNADRYNKMSLVNGFNTIAGVRMEERSPGSYRINIRGSSLRSPFGVRNIKVYWNDIPITDAGGNTYFNQFAYNNFSYLEIFKGPAGSMYGAGTGGLVLMNNFQSFQPGGSIEVIGGSYGLWNLLATARFGGKGNQNQITYAHNKSDGYRVQTEMRRDNFSWMSRINLGDRQKLTASVLFTDMAYQTPGALNLTEFKNDKKAARPAGGGFPSAVDAHATIYQKNLLVGLTDQIKLDTNWKNTTTFYGVFAQVKNPAIRNYERRNEPGYGARSLFTFKKNYEQTELQFVGGGEFQQAFFNTQVSNNRNGNPDTIQTNDDIRFTTYSLFAQGDLSINNNWILTAGISLNKTNVVFSRLNRYPVLKQSRYYKNEFAPRISLLRKFEEKFDLLATISRGFSPPTISELLPSTGVISTDLEAEKGWNYELTVRTDFFHKRLRFEVTGFYFKLDEALVQRRDISGADFFVNAGDIKEKGIELHADYTLMRNTFLNYLTLRGDYTLNHFRYGSFIKGTDDFSGKKVPSVPDNTFSFIADIQFQKGFYTNITFYNASKIFLNDANTAAAEAYYLTGMRIGWSSWKKNSRPNLYVGVDNLFDETYSLGNDINAAGGRYYNAAPGRNYYFGVAMRFNCASKKID